MQRVTNVMVVGRGTMGKPLHARLVQEGFSVTSVGRRDVLVGDTHHDISAITDGYIAGRLSRFIQGVQVAFLAIPSDGDGNTELAYMEYFRAKGIYVITFAKSALAYHYDKLRPHLDMVGRSATVGGGTQILPWLTNLCLPGKDFTMFAYLNASTNYFMDSVSGGASREEAFRSAQAAGLAEPGATDYVAFLNGEIGHDMPMKCCIAMNDTILGTQGMTLKPTDFSYKKLEVSDVEQITSPMSNSRYLLTFSKGKRSTPALSSGQPGELQAKIGNFTISGGFIDVSRNTHVTQWMQGGKTNGVQIRFEGDFESDGMVEIAGEGAGFATVGAAMNDLRKFIARPKALGL